MVYLNQTHCYKAISCQLPLRYKPPQPNLPNQPLESD